MTYGEILTEIMRRTGLGHNEFADAIGFSRAHVSHVMAGTQKGSVKMLEAALALAKIAIEDCVVLPFNGKTETEDKAAVEVMRRAVGRGGEDRLRVLEQAEILRKRMARPKTVQRRISGGSTDAEPPPRRKLRPAIGDT